MSALRPIFFIALLAIAATSEARRLPTLARASATPLAPSAPAPGTPENLFQRAGAAYEAGRFAESAGLYARSMESSGISAPGAYNLGNAYFRMGRVGMAVIWYERSRRLDPRDGDTRYNLEVIRAGGRDAEAGFGETLDRLVTPAELPWIFTVLCWILLVVAGLALWRGLPWRRVRATVVISALLLTVVAAWWIYRARDLGAPRAVVVAPQAEVRSGPGDQFTVGYTIPEGRRALVLNNRPGWTEIAVPGESLKGWVREDLLGRI